AQQARRLREYGWRERCISEIPGGNSRLDELQAAILRVKLRYLDEDNARRIQLAQLYCKGLSSVDLTLPSVASKAQHVYHLFVVRSRVRDELRATLQRKGIGTLIHYPVPIHLQPAYRGRITICGSLAESELAAREVVSLPLYPELPEPAVQTVCDAIAQFFLDAS
ncbi:MAG: DegT/DnrJ/EryC1/StrS family aminotransferase, partial [Verrucomicrobiota bacterium]